MNITVKKTRPVNLNLFTIRFPLPAIASILHRISGVILFLFIPFLLCGLKSSLSSSDQFDRLHENLTGPCAKLFIWAVLTAFIFHFVAGIRHLLMDINIGIELHSGKITALLTMLIVAVLAVLTGIWLW